eukprot:250128-Lingulodinium_polyedra.AAC.1
MEWSNRPVQMAPRGGRHAAVQHAPERGGRGAGLAKTGHLRAELSPPYLPSSRSGRREWPPAAGRQANPPEEGAVRRTH